MITRPTYGEDDHALAGEYALDLLGPEGRAAFEARLLDEPELRRIVAEWEERLAPLAEEITDVAPPPHVWHGIDARLFGKERKPFWARLGVWQSFTAVATGVAATLAIVLFLSGLPEPGSDATLVSEIEASDESFKIVAVMRAGAEAIRVSHIAGEAPEGRVLELWLIAGEDAPVSLGVLPDTARGLVPVPANLRPHLVGAVLAVTDEPPGGAPGGVPTGNILGAGTVSEI